MADSLGAIEDLEDQRTKIEQYKQRLEDIFARHDVSEANAFVDHSKVPFKLASVIKLSFCGRFSS